MSDTKKQRLLWVDCLRSMAIVFVIYGHCGPGRTLFYSITSPIKMPMFFVLSGFLFNTMGKNNVNYYKKIFRSLIIPWIVLSAIGFLPSVCGFLYRQDYSGIGYRIIDIIIGKEHWFMPCFIIGSMLHFFIRKCLKNESLMFLLGLCCFFCGIYLNNYEWSSLFMINRAIHVQLFFTVGYLIKQNINLVITNVRQSILLGIVLYSMLVVLANYYYPNAVMDVHRMYYYDYILCILLVLVGTITLVTISSRFKSFPKWFLFLGRNSLVIYMLQGFGFVLISIIVSIFHLQIDSFNQPLWALVKCVIVLSVCSIISVVINRFIPFATGGRR